MSQKTRPDDTSSPAYIDWQQFNRMVLAKGHGRNPERDSRGDTGVDENFETKLGEGYVDEIHDEEDELALEDDADDEEETLETADGGLEDGIEDPSDEDELIVADFHSTLDNDLGGEEKIERDIGVVSSERPDANKEHIFDPDRSELR